LSLPFFCFRQKKNTADVHRIISETYNENVIIIRTLFKNCDLRSVIKNRRSAAVKEGELWKDGKKSWKTMKNISINLYCIDFLL